MNTVECYPGRERDPEGDGFSDGILCYELRSGTREVTYGLDIVWTDNPPQGKDTDKKSSLERHDEDDVVARNRGKKPKADLIETNSRQLNPTEPNTLIVIHNADCHS